jgi:MOSC domain-containing protein YiiM
MKMNNIVGQVVSVNLGTSNTDLNKEPVTSLQAELDGFVGDRHRSLRRECWEGDKQPEGTIRRNERMWSAMSTEEIAHIEKEMDLKETLLASDMGVNLCLKGIPDLSQLPMGTILKFPSGATLMVEEYNPPCTEMSAKIATKYTTNTGEPLIDSAFSRAAKFSRGLVGIVEAAGVINPGDEVTVEFLKLPIWITRLAK